MNFPRSRTALKPTLHTCTTGLSLFALRFPLTPRSLWLQSTGLGSESSSLPSMPAPERTKARQKRWRIRRERVSCGSCSFPSIAVPTARCRRPATRSPCRRARTRAARRVSTLASGRGMVRSEVWCSPARSLAAADSAASPRRAAAAGAASRCGLRQLEGGGRWPPLHAANAECISSAWPRTGCHLGGGGAVRCG